MKRARAYDHAPLTTASGIAVAFAGFGLVGVGLWARREVERTLARERVVSTPDAVPPRTLVTSARAARSLAEVIRRNTLEATGGRTYAETAEFLDGDGKTTSNKGSALIDERTGKLVENPEHALWLQSMTLQSALMQAYLSARVADLSIGVGAALVGAGAGITAAGVGPRNGGGAG